MAIYCRSHAGSTCHPMSIDRIDAFLFLFRVRFVWFYHNAIIDASRLFDDYIFKIVNDVLSLWDTWENVNDVLSLTS